MKLQTFAQEQPFPGQWRACEHSRLEKLLDCDGVLYFDDLGLVIGQRDLVLGIVCSYLRRQQNLHVNISLLRFGVACTCVQIQWVRPGPCLGGLEGLVWAVAHWSGQSAQFWDILYQSVYLYHTDESYCKTLWNLSWPQRSSADLSSLSLPKTGHFRPLQTTSDVLSSVLDVTGCAQAFSRQARHSYSSPGTNLRGGHDRCLPVPMACCMLYAQIKRDAQFEDGGDRSACIRAFSSPDSISQIDTNKINYVPWHTIRYLYILLWTTMHSIYRFVFCRGLSWHDLTYTRAARDFLDNRRYMYHCRESAGMQACFKR